MGHNWRTVSSSNISQVAYDPDAQTLHIQFSNGSVYRYSDVPQDEYEGLLSAASVGSYFADNIKNGYSYVRA
jgi:KTSC domain